MNKWYITCIFAFFCFTCSLAQSQKKINAELVSVKEVYDSIANLASKKSNTLFSKQTDFTSAQLRNKQRQAIGLMNVFVIVKEKYNQLIRLEKDPAFFLNLDSLEKRVACFQDTLILPVDLLKPQKAVLIQDSGALEKRSGKERKIWLKEQVGHYSLAVEKNQQVIRQMNDQLRIIDSIRPELDSIYWNYENILYDLARVEYKLADTLSKLRAFSLRDWPKNFSPVFERVFGTPEFNEVSQPTSDGYSRYTWYEYLVPVFFIPAANPIPIDEFSVEKMKEWEGVRPGLKPNSSTVYSVVDESAMFPGGKSALMKFLREKIHYPEMAVEISTFKQVVRFEIDVKGTISNVKMERGIPGCPECDEAVIRAVKSMPKWIPAKVNGKAVNSQYSLPITFKH